MASTSTDSTKMDQLKALLKSEHFEVTMRLGLNMFVGYVLTFANIQWVTPIETNILLGILVPFCTMLFPTLMFSVGTLILPLFSLFLFIFVCSSALMAIAATGGIDAFIAVFALWSFWICFTRWDKIEGNKTSIILIGVVFQTVLIFPTVFQASSGFTVPSPSIPPQINRLLLEYTASTTDAARTLGTGVHDVTIQAGFLKGRPCQVTVLEDGTSSMFFEGGLWIVRAAWMSRGMLNPFATYTNFLVMVCWLIVILSLGVLMPPARTMRSAVWRGLLPAAMKDAASAIRLHAARMKHFSSGVKLGDTDGGEEEDISEEKRLGVRARCIYHVNALFAGTLAKYSVFEPRLLLLAHQPAQWTVAILAQLSEITSRCVRIAVGIELLVDSEDESQFLHSLTDEYLHLATVLENCAAAVQTCNTSLLDAVDDRFVQAQGFKATNVHNESPIDDIGDVEVSLSHEVADPFRLKERSDELVSMSRKWIEAMDPNVSSGNGYFSPESSFAFKKNTQPWIQVHFSLIVFLYDVLKSVFQKSTWYNLVKRDTYSLTRAIWCFKYALGMTVLIVCFVYWEEYQNNFVINWSDSSINRGLSLQNGGWTLVAYCFATTQTAEGSIKKGILRMIGTIAGSLSAWVALVICEDGSYSNEYNTYGVIAWLTISSIVATYLVTERGFAARISLSNDYAYGSIYFIITQMIIVCYAFFQYGPGYNGILTVNRLFSNLVGILMAMVLAIVPPGNYGGDPGHCKSLVIAQWDSIKEVLRLLLSCRLSSDGEPLEEDCVKIADQLLKLRERNLQKCTHMQTMTTDYEKDAAKLQKIPLVNVDPALKIEIGKVTRDVTITAFVPQLAARLLSDHSSKSALLHRDGNARKELEAIHSRMHQGFESDEALVPYRTNRSTTSDTDLELFIRTLHWLLNEMSGHKKALEKIKWGIQGASTIH